MEMKMEVLGIGLGIGGAISCGSARTLPQLKRSQHQGKRKATPGKSAVKRTPHAFRLQPAAAPKGAVLGFRKIRPSGFIRGSGHY